MAIKVQFHQIDEFLEELTQEREAVTDRILRITYLHTQHAGMPMVHLSVVAGVLVRGVLIEFVQRCGDLWRMSNESETQALLQVYGIPEVLLHIPGKRRPKPTPKRLAPTDLQYA